MNHPIGPRIRIGSETENNKAENRPAVVPPMTLTKAKRTIADKEQQTTVNRIVRGYNETEPVLTGLPRAQYPETYTQTHERGCMVYCLSSLGNFFMIAPGWDRTRAAGLRGRHDNHYTTTITAGGRVFQPRRSALIARDVYRVAHGKPVFQLKPNIFTGERLTRLKLTLITGYNQLLLNNRRLPMRCGVNPFYRNHGV